MTTQRIDGDAVDLIARQRIKTHHEADNRRPAYAEDDLTAERVGVAVEAAFSIRYNLPAPTYDEVSGDDGFDFAVRYDGERQRIECKGSAYDAPSLMLSDSYQHDAPEYHVLASVSWPSKVRFVGWIHTDRVSDVSKRQPSQFGGWMDVVDGEALKPLPAPESILEVES